MKTKRLALSVSEEGVGCADCLTAVEPIVGRSMLPSADGIEWLWWRCTHCGLITDPLPIPAELVRSTA